MIGGVDIHITVGASESSLIVAARAIRQFWPHAVFENGSTGDRFPSFWDTPFESLEEIFVYRDSAAADLWDAEGAIPAALNTMIHLIADEQFTTVVVDDLNDPTMIAIVSMIKYGLRNDIQNQLAREVA